MKKIELLIFDGCPHSEAAEKIVNESIAELGLQATIEVVNVIDNDDAVAQRFLGSPSIRIQGNDLEIEENELTQYAMQCRIYRDGDRPSGVPPKRLVIEKLKAAK